MFPDLNARQKAVTFYALTLSLCLALCALMRDAGELAAVAAMFTPAVALLLMQLVVTRDGRSRAGWSGLGVRRSGFRFWPFAVVVPIAVLFAAEAVAAAAGLTTVRGPAATLLLDLPIELVLVSGFSFFEEIGWRGYLLPLVGRGPRAGLRVGFLHGLWHLPIVFLVPGAYLTEGSRWLTVPVFLGVLTAAGPIYGWLRERSGSVWPVVLTHGAFNVGLTLMAGIFTTSDPGTVAVVGRETGVATLGFLVLVAAVLTARRPGPAVEVPQRPAAVVSAGRAGQVAGTSAAIAAISITAPGTPRPATRAAVTSGGAAAPEAARRGAIAP